MKKSSIILIAVLAVLAFWCIGAYNTLVQLDENVTAAWGNVETQYQRRADLIPNLVNVVKGYAKHEQGTLTAVIEARSKATSVTIDPSNITPEELAKFQEAQQGVTSALGKLLAVAEAYPDLKADTHFSELQAQLEGTENRIAESRRVFNETAKEYNRKLRTFPNNILGGIFGLSTRSYFESEYGANKAPKVEF
ncbi:MAG: LemA family protein [Paludibacteraceae bacterium]|nr:LemA family protein [Paludibacteraceae bacterium]MBP5480418.1 LemA family protein [Paludibacteraceae bacterium]